jgi:uncharacterized Zn finger protein
MIGFMNHCPHCGGKSSFTPEEMECDKALVLWCGNCGNFINQTLTLETIRRWWLRYDEGEESITPPLSKESVEQLTAIEAQLNEGNTGILERIELHIKDFADYHYTEEGDGNEGTSNS